MKELFKNWPISQKPCFIDATEEETETIIEWLNAFLDDVSALEV
ncbi:hypothetical protein [Glaesserella sp.]